MGRSGIDGPRATERERARRRGDFTPSCVADPIAGQCLPASAALNAGGARCGTGGVGHRLGGIGAAKPIRDPLRRVAGQVKGALGGGTGACRAHRLGQLPRVLHALRRPREHGAIARERVSPRVFRARGIAGGLLPLRLRRQLSPAVPLAKIVCRLPRNAGHRMLFMVAGRGRVPTP